MKVIKDTSFEFGYVVWQVRPPRHSLTLVVKATFTIVHGAQCTIADEQSAVTGDSHWDDDETKSLRTDSDLAVMKPHGECFLAGTCHPPGGRPVGSAAVSFRVGSVEKSLAVFGDRYWSKNLLAGGVTEPLPFTSMPLRYEASFGGPGFEKNPVGRGMVDVDTPDGSRRPLPNIEDPRALIRAPGARPEPAGAFPIPRTWTQRMRKTGTYDGAWLRSRWPYFPDDFDWSFFNAAPADQQIDGYWRGDEEIQLRNLDPERATIETRLPGLRVRAFVEVSDRSGTRIEEPAMHLDTIAVDADVGKVMCVWRGLTEIDDAKARDVGRVFVAHETLDARRTAAEWQQRWVEIERAEVASEAEFEPEPVPRSPFEEKTVTDFARPSPYDERTLSDVHVEPEALSPGETKTLPEASQDRNMAAQIAARLAAVLVAAGLDPAIANAPPPPPPSPEQMAAVETAFAAVGEQVPAPAPKREARAEAPPQRPLRDRVLEMLARGESLTGQDLSDANLAEIDLSGQDLRGAVLTRANLRGARLDGAALDEANLTGADLTGATASGASLKTTDLTGAACEHVAFTDADLTGASLDGARCASASFARARLERVEATAARFEHADFEGARLDGADLSRSVLDDASFANASLVDTTLEGVQASRVRMDDADLTKLRAESATFADGSFRHARASKSRWSESRLERANFSFAHLEKADFRGTVLVQAVLNAVDGRHARFDGASLVGAALLKANGFEASFESADLSHADLRGANLFAAEFWKAKTDHARFEAANVGRTKLESRHG